MLYTWFWTWQQTCSVGRRKFCPRCILPHPPEKPPQPKSRSFELLRCGFPFQGWKGSSVASMDSTRGLQSVASPLLFPAVLSVSEHYPTLGHLWLHYCASLLNGAPSPLFNISHQKLAEIRNFGGGGKGMYSLPKHKVKWAFYLSRPLWNGSIPRICELTRIWSIIRLDQKNLSPRKVGIDSFMTPERVTERQDLHPGPPGLLPFILYPRPRSSHCFADHITFCFMLYIFFPFYYHSTLFFTFVLV